MRNLQIKIAVLLVALMLAAPLVDAARVNQQITITAGTGIRVTTIAGTYVSRIFIQSRHSNIGLIYVSLSVPSATACNASSASQLTAELGPGTSTSPGGSFNDPQGANGNTPSEAEMLLEYALTELTAAMSR